MLPPMADQTVETTAAFAGNHSTAQHRNPADRGMSVFFLTSVAVPIVIGLFDHSAIAHSCGGYPAISP
ncbi:MAG: hypothetical protein IJH79_17485 [Lentisphaeria bacterium]|nr:hypothetical protein [Lentisphaeria bacterium]